MSPTFRESIEPLLGYIEKTEEILAGITAALESGGCYNSSEPLVESVLRLVAERDSERRRADEVSDAEFKQTVLERLAALQSLAQPLWIYADNPHAISAEPMFHAEGPPCS